MWSNVIKRFMITDNYLNLSIVETLSNIKVCVCNKMDRRATCLTSRVLETVESNINSLACRCSRAYTGNFTRWSLLAPFFRFA